MSAEAEILIVEDSLTQSKLLTYILTDAGYRVTATVDGPEALAAARRSKPALVVSDIEMPIMDGYELCRALKSDPQLRDVPVILLTALADVNDVFRGLEAGADCYLTKPYTADDMLASVAFMVANGPASARPATEPPLEVLFHGARHLVTAGRRQILNLLLSTFGIAVERNREATRARFDPQPLHPQPSEAVQHPHVR